MCISRFINIIRCSIMTTIEINSIMYNNDIVKIEQVSRIYGGVCMFKNKNGNCKSKNTFLIHSVEKCVCYLHMTQKQNTVSKLIKFYKNFNRYIKKLSKYINNNNKYIETLKDILLLMITHKKYIYTLQEYFDTVNIYIDNFEINDEEYNALVDYYKFS